MRIEELWPQRRLRPDELAKLAHPFEPQDHPRADDGRFTGARRGSRIDTAPLAQRVPLEERRSLARNSSVWRIGSAVQELPPEYTGSTQRERPLGTFIDVKLAHQVPPGMSDEEHMMRFRNFVRLIQQRRQEVLAEGKTRRASRHTHDRMIPFDTPPGAANRAYNHAAFIALHRHGLVDYDFHMDDHLKKEMKPLSRFVNYAARVLLHDFHSAAPGSWRAYRESFGKPFADRRVGVDGKERRRLRPIHDVIKAAHGA